MKTAALILLSVMNSAAGFQSAMPKPSQPATVLFGGRAATPLGRVSTKEGKAAKIEQVKEQLEKSMLVFAVPSAGLSVSQMGSLRDKLPEDSKAIVVKNKLMARYVFASVLHGDCGPILSLALLNVICLCGIFFHLTRAIMEDDKWSPINDMLTLENMWIFVGEDGLRGSIDGYDAWIKEFNLDECGVKGGASEGKTLDSKGVKAMGKLPTKKELMQKIAVSINMAGAQGIAIRLKNASGQKLAKAIKLAVATEGEGKNK